MYQLIQKLRLSWNQQVLSKILYTNIYRFLSWEIVYSGQETQNSLHD